MAVAQLLWMMALRDRLAGWLAGTQQAHTGHDAGVAASVYGSEVLGG